MDKIRILKGAIIHVNGIPLELTEDICVKGNVRNPKIFDEATRPWNQPAPPPPGSIATRGAPDA